MLTERFPDLIMILSAEGNIKEVNPAFTNQLGFTAAELKGRPYSELLLAHLSSAEEGFPGNAATPVTDVVHQLKSKEGTAVTVRWSGTYLQEDAVFFYTGRIEKEAPPTKREYLFEALVENTFDLLAVTNENGEWTYVSESLAQQIGCTRQELIGQNCFDYIHPDDLKEIASQQVALLQGQKKVQAAPYRFRNAAGQWMWHEAIVSNQLANPDIRGIIITGRNISDRIDAERRAKEVQLLEALREGEEKERGRIARDLHDEISGMIAAAKMHVIALAQTVPAIGANKGYLQALRLLDEAARQVRNTSHNLMPEVLLESGLSQALSRYCHNISNAQLQLQYIALEPVTRYAATFELSLYRIIQELINNIVRHAKATKALVQLNAHGSCLMVTIEDNGIGFNPAATPDGVGLSSIAKRVAHMNGTIDIQSTLGKGTSIYLEFQAEDH